jgi:hypothetical protein
MGYFYQDWKNKKMSVEDSEGQFIMNFGEAEKSMIGNLETAIAKKDISYMEYIKDCLEKGKLELKWNIS